MPEADGSPYAQRGGIWTSQRSHFFKSLFTAFDGLVQILLGVGQREEPGFELRGGEIDPLLHHFNKELGESLRVAHLGRSIISHRPFGKKERE